MTGLKLEKLLILTTKKPEDWDKPKTIPDPNAKKPDDWNDEEDGAWEPSQIPNPDYRGDFSQKMIPNPEYKGEWKPKEIPNPVFKEDKSVWIYPDFSAVGIDVWQVKSGTVFDDILITDSVAAAEKARKEEKKEETKEEAKEETKEEKKDEL